MAHDTHAATHHDGEAHPHPALPPVIDEAPDSPMWLPVAGLSLLAILVLFALFRSATGGDEADLVGADEQAEVEAAPAPAEPAAPPPAAAH